MFFKFSMVAAQIYPNDKKSSVLAMEVNLVTATDPKFWIREDHQLDYILVTSPEISPVTNRGVTSHIDQSFW